MTQQSPQPLKAKRIRIRKGLDLSIADLPIQREHPAPEVRSIGLLGADYINLKPSLLVAVGDRVRLGQPLFADKQDKRLQVTAPGSGTVSAINRGPRRCLDSLVIQLHGSEEETFDRHPAEQLTGLSGENIRETLLRSGQWTALRTRPFGHLANPDIEPAAIFVTAIDTEPMAPSPGITIAANWQQFLDGLTLLGKLTRGRVYLCLAPGVQIPSDMGEQIRPVIFEGPHPAGLVGTHIHHLEPVDENHCVWHLGYQDVIAIGHLFTSGRLWVDRVISIAGSALSCARLIRTRLGASTEDLTRDELEHERCRLISGSCLSGRKAEGKLGYLGRYHHQLSVLSEPLRRRFLDWLRHKPRGTGSTIDRHGKSMAMLPTDRFEQVMPLDILPTPLLKALLIRDLDNALKLGCLELVEEDLALCAHVCWSKQDYGSALRDCLTRIERQRR
jgi:Na+-transporting NADH:ubiquinone oxidoreductase subunit A